MSPLTLQLDQFIRSFTISQNEVFSLFLGAGASINSGIPSAYDCIWHWKQSIYQTKTGFSFNGLDYKSDQVKQHIQRWLNQEGTYPLLDSPEEYSFYIDHATRYPATVASFSEASSRVNTRPLGTNCSCSFTQWSGYTLYGQPILMTYATKQR